MCLNEQLQQAGELEQPQEQLDNMNIAFSFTLKVTDKEQTINGYLEQLVLIEQDGQITERWIKKEDLDWILETLDISID